MPVKKTQAETFVKKCDSLWPASLIRLCFWAGNYHFFCFSNTPFIFSVIAAGFALEALTYTNSFRGSSQGNTRVILCVNSGNAVSCFPVWLQVDRDLAVFAEDSVHRESPEAPWSNIIMSVRSRYVIIAIVNILKHAEYCSNVRWTFITSF